MRLEPEPACRKTTGGPSPLPSPPLSSYCNCTPGSSATLMLDILTHARRTRRGQRRPPPEEFPRHVGEDPGRVPGEGSVLPQGDREPEEVRGTDRPVPPLVVPAL